jgi:hypothetical protein
MQIPKQLAYNVVDDVVVRVEDEETTTMLGRLFAKWPCDCLRTKISTKGGYAKKLLALEDDRITTTPLTDVRTEDWNIISKVEKTPREYFQPPATIFILSDRFLIKKSAESFGTTVWTPEIWIATELSYLDDWLAQPISDLHHYLDGLLKLKDTAEQIFQRNASR